MEHDFTTAVSCQLVSSLLYFLTFLQLSGDDKDVQLPEELETKDRVTKMPMGIKPHTVAHR
jgi:hypothetical protein